MLLKLAVYRRGCLVVLGWLVSLIGNVDFFADRTSYAAELDRRHRPGGERRGEGRRRRGRAGHRHRHRAGPGRGDLRGRRRRRAARVHPGRRPLAQRARARSTSTSIPARAATAWRAGDRIPVEQAVDSADVGELPQRRRPGAAGHRPRRRQRLRPGRDRGRAGQRGARSAACCAMPATWPRPRRHRTPRSAAIIVNLDDVVGALAERDEAVDATARRTSASLSSDLADRNDDARTVVARLRQRPDQLDQPADATTGATSTRTIADLPGDRRVARPSSDADLEAALATLPDGPGAVPPASRPTGSGSRSGP